MVYTKLLYKLWEYGINGDLWNWIRAYLTGRRQCVRVNGTTSEFLPVISGVPQGSLLGPLFYIIFINDMFDSIKVARPFTYADDTKLLSRNSRCSTRLLFVTCFMKNWMREICTFSQMRSHISLLFSTI